MKKFYKWQNNNNWVVIAKNYLTKEELKSLERIVTMYLDKEKQYIFINDFIWSKWQGKFISLLLSYIWVYL